MPPAVGKPWLVTLRSTRKSASPTSKNNPGGRRAYHCKQSAFRPVGGYAGNGSIVSLKRLYRMSSRQLPARSSLTAFAASG